MGLFPVSPINSTRLSFLFLVTLLSDFLSLHIPVWIWKQVCPLVYPSLTRRTTFWNTVAFVNIQTPSPKHEDELNLGERTSYPPISSISKASAVLKSSAAKAVEVTWVVAKQELTYRKVAESIYWRWPFLQLGCSVGHDIVKEGLHGWLMERLLRRRSLLLHQQAWIKLTRLLHHLLLYTKRSTLQTAKWGRKIVSVNLHRYTLFISELTSFQEEGHQSKFYSYYDFWTNSRLTMHT